MLISLIINFFNHQIQSKEEQTTVNSTNPITLMSSYDVGINTTPYANETTGVLRTNNGGAPVLPAAAPNGLITPRMQYALKQQCNFSNCQSNYLNSQIPSPLFLSDDPIHFGAGGKVDLTFMVNPNWVQNLIGIAGSTAAVLQGNPARANFKEVALPAAGVPFAANSNNTIYVAVTDFVLYMYKVPLREEPRSIPKTIHMKKWCTNLYNLTSGSSINGTVSLQDMRHMTHIIIAFLQPTGTTGKSSLTDFSVGFTDAVPEIIRTTTANNNISSFYITYDKQHPAPAYTFGNDATNAMELSRTCII